MFGFFVAVVDARFGVATPLASETPARAADRRAAARAEPADTGVVSARHRALSAAASIAPASPTIGSPAPGAARRHRRPSAATASDRRSRPHPVLDWSAASSDGSASTGSARPPTPRRDRCSLVYVLTSLLLTTGELRRWTALSFDVLQGRQDLNLQPAVLETAALPIELRPFGPLRHRDQPSEPLSHVRDVPTYPTRGQATAHPRTSSVSHRTPSRRTRGSHPTATRPLERAVTYRQAWLHGHRWIALEMTARPVRGTMGPEYQRPGRHRRRLQRRPPAEPAAPAGGSRPASAGSPSPPRWPSTRRPRPSRRPAGR